MTFLRPSFIVSSVLAAATALTSCNESGSQAGLLGAMPQAPARAAHADGKASRMLPGASTGDLLYVPDAGTNEVYLFSYPRLGYVGELDGLTAEPHGVCTDGAGNIFVTEFAFDNNNVQEYSHGGTSPIASLAAPGEPEECSVDPISGNLAVAIYSYNSNPSGVAIYTNAQGTPTLYSDSNVGIVTAASYDDSGNLFIGGNKSRTFRLAELPMGSTTFVDIKLKATINGQIFMPIFWDGHHLAIGNLVDYSKRYLIDRVKIFKGEGTVVGTTSLSLNRSVFSGDTSFFVKGNRIVANAQTPSAQGRVALWAYPQGGDRLRTARKFGSQYTAGVAISVAPSLRGRCATTATKPAGCGVVHAVTP